MAKVLCYQTDCKYIGRKSRLYERRNGEPLYNCKCDCIVLRDEDCTGDEYTLEDYTGKRLFDQRQVLIEAYKCIGGNDV